MNFIENQWYRDGERYYCYTGINQLDNTRLLFRKAGKVASTSLDKAVIELLSPASLTPDFSNAKVGDECWHGVGGFMLVNDIYDDGKAISIKYDNSLKAKKYRCDESDLGGITTIYTYRNGYVPFRHPELFNSFAQFLAYWQEEALKLKGCEK